jgi:hypothetical protein
MTYYVDKDNYFYVLCDNCKNTNAWIETLRNISLEDLKNEIKNNYCVILNLSCVCNICTGKKNNNSFLEIHFYRKCDNCESIRKSMDCDDIRIRDFGHQSIIYNIKYTETYECFYLQFSSIPDTRFQKVHYDSLEYAKNSVVKYEEMLDLIEDNTVLDISTNMNKLTDSASYNKLCQDLQSKSLYLEKLYEYYVELDWPSLYFETEFIFCVKRLNNTKRALKGEL